VHVVLAPLALLTIVSTVPNDSVGLAQYPADAAAYHVASPTSLWAGAGRVVVVVVGGAVVVVVGGNVVVVGGGSVVVVGGAVVVVVDPGAWYATRCDGRFTVSGRDDGCAAFSCASCSTCAAAAGRDAGAALLCNSRRGAPNNAPQMTAATPRRLPPVLWFRRAPPFSGDTVHPRRHTGGEGFRRS